MFFRVVTASLVFVLAWEIPSQAAKVKPQPSSCQFAADPAWCQVKFDAFAGDLPKANRGDYLAQREIAFCFSGGCDGAVAIDMIKACTWQTVIVSTDKSDVTDAFNYRYQCELLKQPDRDTAKAAAATLFVTIYKRPMSKPLPYEGSPKP
jgi:hypothetical protein